MRYMVVDEVPRKDGNVEVIYQFSTFRHPDGAELQGIGWGGSTRVVMGPYMHLGIGRYRGGVKPTGLRMMIWDICLGYVSGFRKRDILWYVLTRSLNPINMRKLQRLNRDSRRAENLRRIQNLKEL